MTSHFPPFWSKQHGAYISLAVCWLLAVLLSDGLYAIQFVILVFLMSGLNAGELLIEKFKRKSPLPGAKRFWLVLYTGFTLISGVLIAWKVPLFLKLFPLFAVSGLAFVLLALRRLQKSVVAEWITFALFSAAGLLAYHNGAEVSLSDISGILLLMSLYFGMSVFLVKFWLDKLPSFAGMIYVMLAILAIYFIYPWNSLTATISALLLIKSLQVILFPAWYRRLKIKQIGMIEFGWHLVFVVLMYLNKEMLI